MAEVMLYNNTEVLLRKTGACSNHLICKSSLCINLEVLGNVLHISLKGSLLIYSFI